MPDNIIQFIWTYSRKQQFWLILLTFASFPLLYVSLEIPKLIINEALSGESGVRHFLGWDVTPFQLLMWLSFSLLALVLINGLFKMVINTQKGIVGETLVRRLRYMLLERLLRFPPRKFEQLSQGEVIATVVQETDPLGGFAGDAFAHPLLQGGTLLTILLFMFMQDWVLGVASIALVPVQLFIIPYLQRQINLLRKQRVKRARVLSRRIGETVQSANEIRIQGTRRYTLAEFSYRFGELYYIRLALFKKKFFMKFLNNTLNQLTPFMFYAIGGYLVLEGRLTIGALVAAIAAHKDFLSPWRELLSFYETWQDNLVRYQQIVEQFNPHNMQVLPESAEPVDEAFFRQTLIMQQVNIRNDSHEPLLSYLNLELKPGEWVVVQSPDLVLRQAFAQCLVGLAKPYSGFVGFEGRSLDSLAEADLRQNLGFVNEQAHLFNASVAYNIGYGLNHQPPLVELEKHLGLLVDSVKSGNSTDWFDESFLGSWGNLSRFNVEDWSEMQGWLREQMDIFNVTDRLTTLSLQEVFNPLSYPEEVFGQLVDDLLVARQFMREEISTQGRDVRMEQYDINRLNRFAPMLDNLVFGTVAGNTEVLRPVLMKTIIEALAENDLLKPSLSIAERCLRKLMVQYKRLAEGHPFVEQFELHDEQRVADLKQLSHMLEADVDAAVSDPACSAELMDIFVRMVPQEWLDIWLEPDYVDRLLTLRNTMMQRLAERLGDAYFPFIEDKYNPGLSVMNNVLFGRIDPHCSDTADYLQERATYWVLDKANKNDLVRLFVVNTQVGVNGSRIPVQVHHLLSLMRTLLKRPVILVLQDALIAQSDEEKLAILQRIRQSRPDLTLVRVTAEQSHLEMFDRYLQLTPTGLVEQDKPAV